MGLAVGLVALFGTVTIFKVHDILLSNMKTLLKEESLSVAREMSPHAREHILINDIYGLTRLLRSTVENRPEVHYAFVVDNDHEILAHSFTNGFPKNLIKQIHKDNLQEQILPLSTTEGIVWDSFYPIPETGFGGVRVGVSETLMQEQISAFLRSLFLHTLGAILVALVLSILLAHILTRPIKQLLDATQALKQGNYDCIQTKFLQDEVGHLVRAFNDMLLQLQQAEHDRQDKEKIRKEFLQRIIGTQEQERKRVARELHDQTGQALTSIMVRLKMLDKAQPTELSREIAALKETLIEEIGALHHLALELRPSVLDDMGLAPALEHYSAQFQERHGVEIKLVTIDMEDKRADLCVETCIYRIIQESLTNVARHANARHISILLEWRQDQLRGIIEDDGNGFNPEGVSKERLGLYGMEERARLLGGTLKIDSEPGEGTLVSFNLPAQCISECYE